MCFLEAKWIYFILLVQILILNINQVFDFAKISNPCQSSIFHLICEVREGDMKYYGMLPKGLAKIKDLIKSTSLFAFLGELEKEIS